MIATHEADCYDGKILLCSVRNDPDNPNMVFGLVVRDCRNNRSFHTGERIWISAKQVSYREEPGHGYWEVGDY